MSAIKKAYVAPAIVEQEHVVKATRMKTVGIVEPNGFLPRDSAGDIGFGL